MVMTGRITAMGLEEVLIGVVRAGDPDRPGGAVRRIAEGRADPVDGAGHYQPEHTARGPRARSARRRPPPVRAGQGLHPRRGPAARRCPARRRWARRPRDPRPARRARPDGAQHRGRHHPRLLRRPPPPAPGPSPTTDAPGTMRPAGGLTPKPASPGRLRASPNSSTRGGSTTTTSTDSPPRAG